MQGNRRVLSLAARTGRIGCVYLMNGELKDWALSCKGSMSKENASEVFKQWIDHYSPDTIISENPDTATRKSSQQKTILKVFADIAEDSPALNILVSRQKTHKNIFVEAVALAERYPLIKDKVPKHPPIWMPEPRNTIYFEALAMAEQVLVKR